jgi:hypothetical protein
VLLQKVLAKMGCPEALQDIKDELAITTIQAVKDELNVMVQGLAEIDKQCSSSALNMT